ncbi:hypothetical protein Vadar_002852 [Vaccinium darrowii]|uniref:Uncharacterized protein n=1 Tax=Vaccinium darrowii TaxID=229202 RepID=A0ACB7X7M9_9ERIC|nr:hypothetical protein Vadar_002852 [Vaccinium darrowii]
MNSLVITAPREGHPRTVKPPSSVSHNHWFKVKHPKFPQPEIPLSKSQKCQRQRIRQAEHLAKGIPTPPPIPPKRSSKIQQHHTRIEYRLVKHQASSSKAPTTSPPPVPKLSKPIWKDILTKPRALMIRTFGDSMVVKETPPIIDVSSSLANLSCNMVFVLPQAFMAKEGQPSSMVGDVEFTGDTPIMDASTPVISSPSPTSPLIVTPSSNIPSIVILKDEPSVYIPSPVASILFEKPNPLMTQHLRPLYVQGHLDGVPVTRILVDNGSAANIMPRFMMIKLGKGDQDILPSSASIFDFAGGVTIAQGIIIMNL